MKKHIHYIIKTRIKKGHFRAPKKEFSDVKANRIEQLPMDMTDTYRDPSRDIRLGLCQECGWAQMSQEEYEQWTHNRTN